MELYRTTIRWTLLAWLVILIVTLRLSGLTLAFSEISVRALACSSVIACGMLYQPGRSIRLDRIVLFLESAALFAAVALLAYIQSYVIAASTSGYVDNALVHFDRMAGLDWVSYWTFCHSHPMIFGALDFGYMSINLSPLILLAALSAKGNSVACYRLVLVFALALAVTETIFLFTPATSAAFHYLGAHAANLPRAGVDHIAVIESLRDGRANDIHFTIKSGLITFPSFHAASAIIFYRAARETGIVRFPLYVINILMFLAAPIQGGHYFADVLAGLLVALFAIYVVDRAFSFVLAAQARPAGWRQPSGASRTICP